MMNKAVFMDRDHTLIEDPGYLADPGGVKLLPGVELALKSLATEGYKLVVVTNQSGVARGLLTEETLSRIHAEMRRQLADKGARVDAIYYCPYHPEGTVEAYAVDSDLRKPRPGMLLKASVDLGIDLSQSWMVGDSPRDVEAGQRAGCRTIRVRTGGQVAPGEDEEEDTQADFVVRNLVDAARIVLREGGRSPRVEIPKETPEPAIESPALADEPGEPAERVEAAAIEEPAVETAEEVAEEATPKRVSSALPTQVAIDAMDDSQVRREILRYLRQYVRGNEQEEFSASKLVAGIVQVLAGLSLLVCLWRTFSGEASTQQGILWAVIAMTLQTMALTFFVMRRNR